MTTLHQCLASQLIGDCEDTGTFEGVERDNLRLEQTKALASTITTIEADLKEMLPKPEVPSGGKSEFDDMNPFDAYGVGYNQAIADMSAAIERYCRGENEVQN